MTAWSQRLARRSRPLTVVVLVAAVVVGGIGAASAATLGGLRSTTLYSSSRPADPPTVATLACDTFALAAPTGTALANRPMRPAATCGTATWTVHSGNWVIINGDVDAGQEDASATVPIGITNMSVSATLVNSSGGGRAAGVAISHSGANRTFLAAMIVGNNQAHLRIVVNGGAPQTLASTKVTVGATSVVRLTRVGNTITMRVDGVVLITYTLSAAEAAQLTGTRAGLFRQKGNPLRFRTFLVTQAQP